MVNDLDGWLSLSLTTSDAGSFCRNAPPMRACRGGPSIASGTPRINQPRKLWFFTLFAMMVGSTISPQQMHFHASKDLTKS
jgi:hypothetical protein